MQEENGVKYKKNQEQSNINLGMNFFFGKKKNPRCGVVYNNHAKMIFISKTNFQSDVPRSVQNNLSAI